VNLIEYLDTKKYAIKVLLSIYKGYLEGEILNNERIWKGIRCSKNIVYDVVKKFTEMGIIERELLENHYPIMKVIHFTEEGNRIARLLYEFSQEVSDIELEDD
jgi:predicted transcriptional regulator